MKVRVLGFVGGAALAASAFGVPFFGSTAEAYSRCVAEMIRDGVADGSFPAGQGDEEFQKGTNRSLMEGYKILCLQKPD